MTNRLAIMDYGIGGLDLFRRVKQIRPELGITYFSDSGEVPYGKLSKDKLHKRVSKVINFLKRKGANQIIIACHSASSVSSLIESDGIIDLVDSTIYDPFAMQSQYLGIIGGGRTIHSGIYAQHFRNQGIKINQRVAQPLSILVEQGEIDSSRVYGEIKRILKPIKSVDSLLLACTHYPVLRPQIQAYLGTSCRIIDPLDNLLDRIKPMLYKVNNGKDMFYTTGDKELMIQVANSLYGIGVHDIHSISGFSGGHLS
ncbi:MAG: aspartate/glutamate racemase family protein [Bacteroidota bacterium]